MDALSESLRMLRLSGALFVEAEMPAQWCYLSPTTQSLSEEFVAGRRVLAFHLLVRGRCIASLPGGPPIEMAPGELLLFPRGEQHILASSLDAFASLPPRPVQCDALRSTGSTFQHHEPYPTRLICGYVACGGADGMAALTGLPDLVRVRGDEQFAEWLHASLKYCRLRWGSEHSGFTPIAERILELMLLQAVRQHRSERDAVPQQLAPLAAMDRLLQRALSLVHGNAARSWTVEELSGRVGLSRSALAARFVQHFGVPPKHYFARWRMALAAEALLSTHRPLLQIANDVGYDSEAAFSRAFRRVYGAPPARWRKDVRAGSRSLTTAVEAAAPRVLSTGSASPAPSEGPPAPRNMGQPQR